MKLSLRLIIFLFLSAHLYPSLMVAQTLSPDFGEDGKVLTDFYGGNERTTKTLVQPDGKMLIAGYYYEDHNGKSAEDFVIIRLNSDGSMDHSFGNKGKVTTDFSEGSSNSGDFGQDMVLQPDGKIILAGSTNLNGSAIMARYHSDGSLDNSFGTNGKVKTKATDLTNVHTLGMGAIVLQSDGKIVLGGSIYYTGSDHNHDRFALLRYNTDGSLDTTYGNDGLASFEFEVYNDNTSDYLKRDAGITALAIQPDDKVVAVGHADNWFNSGDFCALARFNPSGNLDTSFATNGTRVLRVSENHKDTASDVAIKPDGRIVMVGNSIKLDLKVGSDPHEYPLLVACFTADGSLDSGFGTNGLVSDDLRELGNVNHANSVAIQPDGKIVVAGESQFMTSGNRIDVALVRYNNDGTHDLSFGEQGRVYTDFEVPGRPIDRANAITLTPEGDIVMAGESSQYPSIYHFAIARYTSDGSLDTDFSVDGKLSMSIRKTPASSRSVAVQSDDKIIVGGYVSKRYGLARYYTDGKIDSTFNSSGRVIIGMGGEFAVEKVLIQPDGKIIAAGEGQAPQQSKKGFGLLRLNADGTLDSSFGDEGKSFSPELPAFSYANTALLQNDGKILIGGRTTLQSSETEFLLQRYHTDGSMDTDFGTDGIVTTNFASTAWADGIFALSEQTDGKIVAAGRADEKFTLTRYHADGSLDQSFGTAGIVQTNFGGRSAISDMVIQTDGKITVGGHDYGAFTYNQFALARYNPDGSLDTSFGTNGKVTTDFGILSGHQFLVEEIHSITYQEDGKLIVFGQSGTNNKLTYAMARYNADGSLDVDFGDNGMYSSDYDDNFGTPEAAILLPNHQLLTVGTYDSSFALTRFNLDGTLSVPTVEDPDATSIIKVYPNPSTGRFSIHTKQKISNIEVYNLMGQKITSNTVSLHSDAVGTMDLSKEVSGVYFIHFETESGITHTKKIIVQ